MQFVVITDPGLASDGEVWISKDGDEKNTQNLPPVRLATL